MQDTTTNLLEWLEFKIWKAPNIGKQVEQQGLPFITCRNAKWYNQFERQFGNFL